jgi:glucosamine--fructose-6-phosphate aminotransferase (isomerizing)
MCGIFGYVGPQDQDAVSIVMQGLKRLEYRGYDSAGIAGLKNGEVVVCKEVGKVDVLQKLVDEKKISLELAIAQTRWATHGKPSKENAHPHFDTALSLALVHNGIIENYESLKKSLKEKGVQFISDTDTEVIAHLIASLYEGDILKAVKETILLLKGSFALAIIHRDYPGQIIAVAHESPLVIGIGAREAFIASDSNSFSVHTREVVFLSNSEIAVIKSDKLEIYDSFCTPIDKKIQQLSLEAGNISKGGYEHYTIKEIFEQPQTIRNALLSRFLEEYGTAIFEGLNLEINELHSVQRILILACGTSYHAGLVSSYMFEDKARIPVQVEISSEFRYKNPVVQPGTFVIAISQSGETADTLAAVRELKAKGAKILALCNVQGSSLSRESDATIFLRAGPEIGVCSTKAFTSQLVVLSLFALLLARMRHMSKQEGQELIKAMKTLPEQVQKILDKSSSIQTIAKKYAKYNNFFYLGRNYMFPTSLEGALKLKEISYINANGYPAGEMKHGPIALINENCPTVALCSNKMTFDKLISNLMEIKARNGLILAIAEESEKGLEGIATDLITIPDTIDELAPITTSVVTQLLAYYIAKERGAEIDQPKNLAKSVTVE